MRVRAPSDVRATGHSCCDQGVASVKAAVTWPHKNKRCVCEARKRYDDV